LKIKKLVGDRPFGLSEQDYQNILEAREGDIFYLTEPEISEVMERQAKARLTKVSVIGEMHIFEASGTVDEDVMMQLEQKLRMGKN
jgi:hypothetical protein